jgi:hypothetical protein
MNEKDGPTYSGPTGESWIDVTAISIGVAHKILNWLVSEETTLSDHNLIPFSLRTRRNIKQLNRTPGLHTRNYATQAGNWYSLKQGVLKHRRNWEDHINKAQTKEELDNAITTIWDNLEDICHTSFPTFLPKAKYVPWWTPKLNTLRKRVNALKRRIKRTKNQALRESYNKQYKDIKNQYKTEILKAKLDSWKAFCTEHANSFPYQIYKMRKAGFARNPVPSTLTLSDGMTIT